MPIPSEIPVYTRCEGCGKIFTEIHCALEHTHSPGGAYSLVQFIDGVELQTFVLELTQRTLDTQTHAGPDAGPITLSYVPGTFANNKEKTT